MVILAKLCWSHSLAVLYVKEVLLLGSHNIHLLILHKGCNPIYVFAYNVKK